MCGLELSMWFTDKETLASKYSIRVEDRESELVELPDEDKDVKRTFPIFAFELFDEDKDWWGKDASEAEGATIKPSVSLLILDPQNDFHEGGSLAVPGSTEDSHRIRDLIRRNIDNIDDIIVTMDSHYPNHIAHAIFWVKGLELENNLGCTVDRHPYPFTIITSREIEEGIWVPVDKSMLPWCLFYTRELEKKGKFKLTIWPDHCIIGSSGHAIFPPINEAIQKWAIRRNKSVTYVMKGQNLRTEMYSALAADVEDPTDPTTALNTKLISKLRTLDRIYVCGQARR